MLQGTARPEFLFITAATTLAWTLAAAGATLAAGNPWATRALYPIILALGLSFGASWTLMATIVSEVFGLRYFATNYALVQLASMAASFVFPSAVVARLYDRAAAAQHPPGAHGDLSCTGTPCFLWAFLAMAALAVLVRPPPRGMHVGMYIEFYVLAGSTRTLTSLGATWERMWQIDTWTLLMRIVTDVAQLPGDSPWIAYGLLSVILRSGHDMPARCGAGISLHNMPTRPAA